MGVTDEIRERPGLRLAATIVSIAVVAAACLAVATVLAPPRRAPEPLAPAEVAIQGEGVVRDESDGAADREDGNGTVDQEDGNGTADQEDGNGARDDVDSPEEKAPRAGEDTARDDVDAPEENTPQAGEDTARDDVDAPEEKAPRAGEDTARDDVDAPEENTPQAGEDTAQVDTRGGVRDRAIGDDPDDPVPVYAMPLGWAGRIEDPDGLLAGMGEQRVANLAHDVVDLLDREGHIVGVPVVVGREQVPELYPGTPGERVYLMLEGLGVAVEATCPLEGDKWFASELHRTVAGVNDDPLIKIVGGEVAIHETNTVAALTCPALAEGLYEALARWGAQTGTAIGYTTMQADTVRQAGDGGWEFRVYTFTAVQQVPTTTFIDVSWSPDGTFAFATVG